MSQPHDPSEPPAAAPAPAPAGTPPEELTREERQLRLVMILWATSFVLEIALYLWWAWSGPPESRAFAVNSVAKDLTFLLLALLVIANVRRFERLMIFIALGHLAIALTLAALVLSGTTAVNFPNTPEPVFGIHIADPGSWQLYWWLGAATLATACFAVLHVRARRSVLGLSFLSPTRYETLVALAETVLDDPCVAPATIARAVDHHWATFNGRETGRVKLALLALYAWPMLPTTLRAPFPLLSAESRRDFVERRFLRDGVVLPSVARPAIRFCIQMVHMGYYSRPETNAVTGYQPFSQRAQPPPRAPTRLRTIAPDRARAEAPDAEVVIVGSGAAAGVLAHELAGRGRDVLLLERGNHVDPATFTENELEMYSRLYSDGAIQLSRDFSFQVLQGRCVGGGTVVNNAVCIEPAPEVLDAWNDGGAGLPATLRPSLDAVRRLIGVSLQDAPHQRSLGVQAVSAAVARLQLDRPPYSAGPVEGNQQGCLGCGYCNMGCAYGRKLSMLDRVLPDAQQAADAHRAADPDFRGRLRVLPACEVTSIDRDALIGAGAHRVSGVGCRVGSDRRRMRIKAGTVVVAGGAIASSRLLQRSRIGGGGVGDGLCANIATFMTGDFDAEMLGFAGLQIASYVQPPQQRGYMLETWFDPVVITALSMPGWLEKHQCNMRRYKNMMCVGLLVGTDPQRANHVRRFPLARSDFAFTPSQADLGRVAAALREAGTILFEARAKRVMPPTFHYREFTRAAELDELDAMIMRKGNPSLQTAHPQGGNAVNEDPARGVVDPTFRVHGYENLYVCDASVFPTAVTVNPQLTVMAVAHHAATHPAGLGAL